MLVSPIYDINYPRANSTRPDCINRGAQNGRTLTNSCFRLNSYGNIVVDRRGGAFANDLYVVLDDNRFGTPASTNADSSSSARPTAATPGSARPG